MKEQGIKPKKRKQHVEEGNDDCGEDLSGLGNNIILYGCDWTSGWAEADEVFSFPAASSGDMPDGPLVTPPPHPDLPEGVKRPPYGTGLCPACSSNMWKNHPRHSRIPGRCHFHDVPSIAGHGVPRVGIIALKAPACHMHLQS